MTDQSTTFRIRVPTDHGMYWVGAVSGYFDGNDGQKVRSVNIVNVEEEARSWPREEADDLLAYLIKQWTTAELEEG